MAVSKTTLSLSALAFALLFGGGVYLLTNLNALALPMTEKIASQALGVAVRISDMDISLKEKSARVSGITIANPEGFSKPYALTVQSVDVALDSVAPGLIRFQTIRVDRTDINLEVMADGTNLHALQKKAGGGQAAGDTAENPVKVVIDRFDLVQARLNPSVTLLEEQDLEAVIMPDIALKGIGEKDGGVVAQEAVAQIVSYILRTASQSAGSAGFYQGLSPDMLKELGATQIDQIKNQISNGMGKIKDSLSGMKKMFE